MKKIINAFVSFCESFGKARAAAALARRGHPDLAKQLMLRD
jgi:hypothetical protein